MIPKQTSIDFTSWLRAAFAQPGGGYTDGALLERFVSERDEAAFAVLVKRHGAMVLGVCRRVLGDATDAEDAFQATFLVLVKKARSLRGRAVIGDWLHGVARRTALKARAAAARRRTVEQRAAKADKHIDESRNDWLPRLDEELSRLPEKYRLPIVLCDLENRTRKEAARQLGWPEGTVAGRIARGRELLAKRLLRGAQAVVGMASAGVVGGTAHAAVPVRLVYSTIQAATAVAAGGGAATGLVSAATLTLTKGVVHAMFWTKVKTVSVVLVATAVLAGGAGTTYQIVAEGGGQSVLGGGVSQVLSAAAVGQIAQKQDDKTVQLAKEAFDKQLKGFVDGKDGPESVLRASTLLLETELQTKEGKTGPAAAHQANILRVEKINEIAWQRFHKKTLTERQVDQVSKMRQEIRDSAIAARVKQNFENRKNVTDKEHALLVAAVAHWEARWKEYEAGKITVDFLINASSLWLKAELKVSPQKADIVAAHQGNVERLKEAEKVAQAKYNSGTISVGQLQLTIYHRIEAEITLDEARRGK